MPPADSWYYHHNGQQIGPISAAEVRKAASQGMLSPNDLVWREGLTDWVEASKVKGLFPAGTMQSPPSPATRPGVRQAAQDQDSTSQRSPASSRSTEETRSSRAADTTAASKGSGTKRRPAPSKRSDVELDEHDEDDEDDDELDDLAEVDDDEEEDSPEEIAAQRRRAKQIRERREGRSTGRGQRRLRTASFERRFAALILDNLILGLIGIPVAMVYGALREKPLEPLSEPFSAPTLIIGWIISWLYFSLLYSSDAQASFGKRALGLRVTDLNGRRIDFGQASLRWLAWKLCGLPTRNSRRGFLRTWPEGAGGMASAQRCAV